MARITLRDAAQWCGGTVEEKYADVVFDGAGNDTRSLQPGQLFIALQGIRDGHDYIPAAMERGAAAVLCSRRVGDYPAIITRDPRTALGDIARETLKRIGAKVVAVTGSVGKSTTKEMIAAVLSGTFRVSRTPANHNNDIGMPMAILDMPGDTEVAVLEMGMNHFREIAYLSCIAHPDVAVIINIGTAHIEYLGTQQGIRQAKFEILEGMTPQGMLLLNGDDTMLRCLDVTPKQRITYFGASEGCDVRAQDIGQKDGVLRFTVEAGRLTFPVEMKLEGEHYVADALAAVTVGLKLGVHPDKIRQQLDAFQNMSGRQEIFEAKGCTIINDCYNAGPESMAAALNVLGNRPGRHIAVLGDMLELGDCAQAEHYKIGRIAAEKADMVFAFGPHAGRVLDGTITGGMPENMGRAFESREELVTALRRAVKPGDVILFKGSHGMHLEKVLKAFLKEEK
ncbi:MAG: UDP-N-acetylmuramoyl-tripeptide--D-alanyl-D-alanine ligase [Candidatus Faecousia sp.]|nr:UDP-N-acetylmuramoyl-tripeptide--D-alanyl-D-alanine ligase [Clostridiales bacterium]MCI6935840.1 UDP-N-acetylmuramoyl-tripeptide--D-alanyl-D-alanine ligase [Clostridiales bacterium]MDY4599606.1 UDP-N-acetylmuramoyl-tripeptide--D-alanyl-D-alanine ligase [Candidatus Faecousia sp.]